jgi:Flp pilus assembly protein TadD
LRASGTLHLASAKKRKWVQLRDGYPIAVRSNLVRETLGRHLLRTRRISKELLEESRVEAEKRGVRQGEVLVAMEALSDEDVAKALRDQADEKFFEIFSWTKGSFRFEREGRLQRANALGLGRSPANLILEGVRTRFPLERIDAYFESQARRFVAHGENPFYRFQDVHVAPDNEQLLREIDGTQPLGDFRRVDEALRRTVYALLASGLLELLAKPAVPKPRPKPAPKPKVEPVPRHVAEDRVAEPKHPDTRQDDPRLSELMALADQMRAEDPRAVLGLDAGAKSADVREAYERLSARAHPDRYKDGSQSLRALAADVYARVHSAYETLTDPRTKKMEELASKKLEREERERQRSERAFQAEVEARQGEEAMTARSYETALAHFGKALELFPDEGDHHAYYGYVLHLCHPGDAGMVAEAMEHVKRGLKLASHREKPYLFLGRLHKAVGQADQAEKMFLRAVQIEPECLEAIREVRLIQMRREKSKGLIGRLFKR